MASNGPGDDLSHQAEGDNSASRVVSDQSSKHVCHCGRSFLRKEHLRRHQATHGERGFTCSICQRSFTRNDLLRRHLTRHDTTIAGPRRGRACDACHANKTKCDGGPQCSLCSKRNIECTYKLVDSSNKVHAAPVATVAEESADRDEIHVAIGGEDTVDIPMSDTDQVVTSNNLNVQARTQVRPDETPMGMLARLTNDAANPAVSSEADYPITPTEEEWLTSTSQKYFTRLHETWPVVHSVTFYSEPSSFASLATVTMIALWLQEPEKLAEPVITLHKALMNRLFDDLTSCQPIDRADKRWPIGTFQGSLLNIIFAFYIGSEALVSRAVVLRGMLITTVRELECLICESGSRQLQTHYPGTFFPYVQTNRERWKRLVASLYKIDAYLAIAREQVPILYREELDVALTSTYALWNSWGLDVLYKRLPNEPSDRAGFKFSVVLNNPQSPARSLLLIEDVQLGLCGLLPAIWNHTQICRRKTEVAPSATNSLASLLWRIEGWKAELDRISGHCEQQYAQDKLDELPFIAYFGEETKDPAAWKLAAITHVRGLVSDASMLYHLLAISLCIDTRSIRVVAAYLEKSGQTDPLPPPRIQKHQSRLYTWVMTPESRKALVHAIAVLMARETEVAQNTRVEPLDPIAHMAIAMSSLTVWAWMMFAEQACSCVPGLNHINIGVDIPDLQSTPLLENWIQSGGTIGLRGIAFCRCIVGSWMARFASLLPQGQHAWELGYQIAPVLQPFRK